MTKNPRRYIIHDFYCINCGERANMLPRIEGQFREKGHRKVMYCPHCRQVVNMVECRNDAEVFEFKMDFAEGLFEKEAKESMEIVKESGLIYEY